MILVPTSVSHAGFDLNINLSLKHPAEDFNSFRMTAKARHVHWCDLILVWIGIGSIIEQDLDQLWVTMVRCPMQRCHLELRRYVIDICAALD